MSTPRASVIIPAYFSTTTLRACLLALRRQTWRDFEIIVVNSSAEADTEALVRREFPEVHFRQSSRRLLPHAARNVGVAEARGEILVFTDPDCEAALTWLERLIGAHDDGHAVVGGSMGMIGAGSLETAIHLGKFSWLLPGLTGGEVRTVCTANVCYSRAAFASAGPFDPDIFIGDAVLAWRAAARGFGPRFEPAATVEHRHEDRLRASVRQFHTRGIECGGARIRVERWSRAKALGRAVLAPLLLASTVLRAGIDSWHAGWGARFLRALPLVILLRGAWAAGEVRAQLGFAWNGEVPPSCREVRP